MTARIITEGPLERSDEDDFSGVSIPFEATRTNAGTVIRVCAELEPAAREFARRFAGAETSAEAEVWLSDAAAPILAAKGLERAEDCGRLLIFKSCARSALPARIIKAGAAPFDPEISGAAPFNPEMNFENLTSFELEEPEDTDLPAFVAAEGNKIVSAAVAVPCDCGGEAAEIGVETAEGFRGRGYATACVRALARELNRRGTDALYLAQADNPASVSVARNSGFEEYGSVLQLVCRERS